MVSGTVSKRPMSPATARAEKKPRLRIKMLSNRRSVWCRDISTLLFELVSALRAELR